MYTVIYDDLGHVTGVLRGDNVTLPLDPENRDFREFLEWNAGATQPIDWQTPKPMPSRVNFNSVLCANADDVDRVTISRIYEFILPGEPRDLQQTREMRMVKDAIAAQLTLANPATSDADKQVAQQILTTLLTAEAQIDTIRAAGNTFKMAQGWA